jgi:GNAT superfamily N-acetyltransferase
VISPATVEDALRGAALLREVVAERVVTPVAIRYHMEIATPDDRMRWWKAERDGELVGWAIGGLDAFAPVRTVSFVGVVVHPDHRRNGIGSALWEAVRPHLDEAGARRVLAFGQADPGSIAFAEAKGFRLEGTHVTLALDPRRLPPVPEPPPGVEIVPMRNVEHEPERIYAADSESAQDEPGPTDLSGMTLDVWRRLIWNNPACDKDVSMVAIVDGELVGSSFLYTDRETGRAANSGTGVMRAYRGRGLGLVMKHHSLAAAAAVGITRVVTQNDDTNVPMLAINRRLGYEAYSTGHAWVLEW